MAFIAKCTSIPIPELYYYFEDNKAVYLVMEYIKGVSTNKPEEEKRKVVEKEVEGYLEVLKKLRSKFRGRPSGIICCLY